MSECRGCGTEVDQGDAFVWYRPQGYQPMLLHLTCFDGWQEAGCPGQRRDYGEAPPQPPERLGFFERITRSLTNAIWGGF